MQRSRAGVGIVYVSHRLPEVLGIADRISVLRDGVEQGTFEAAGIGRGLVALMIGRPLSSPSPTARARAEQPEVMLEVSGFAATGSAPST